VPEGRMRCGFTSQPFKDVLQSRPPLVSRHPITFAPHSSIPVWQPGYCPRTFFRLAGRFLSHIPCYSDRQARKPTST
jgi:hypothetical protein